MERIVVWGGGELGATVVRRIAELELAREVVLVEPDESRARGKALDLAQSGPVEGYDTRVVGAGSLEAAGPAQAVVAADPPELEGPEGLKAAIDLLVRAVGNGLLLFAANDAVPLVEMAVNRGMKRDRVFGTRPVAEAAAIRHALAEEIGLQASQVHLALLGVPGQWIVPAGSVTASGLSVDAAWPTAVRRAVQQAQRKARGPVALAAGAARFLAAVQGVRDTVLPVTLVLEGELGRRGVALAVPARLGGARLRAIVEPPLDPVDRIALDNAALRRAGRV